LINGNVEYRIGQQITMTKLKGKICLRSIRRKWKPSVFAQTTSIAVRRGALIADEVEVGGGLREDGSTEVAEMLMPQVDGDGVEAVTRREERVEITIGITSEKNRLGGWILD
jgi:hypothetical protein